MISGWDKIVPETREIGNVTTATLGDEGVVYVDEFFTP